MFFENVKKITVERIKNKNTLGICMEKLNQETLLLGTVLEKANCENFQIPIIIGVDKDLNDIIIDLYKIPHFLVAGTTGSGKTNFLNNIFAELIHKFTPNEQRFILIDTRGVNFPLFNKIPHLLIPTITEKKKALGALAWLLDEMENRYQIFQRLGAKDLNSYNNLIEKAEGEKLPQICVFIDDVSDLMDESNDMLEECLIRLSQKSRAAGIYFILATYRPSVSILNGIIKKMSFLWRLINKRILMKSKITMYLILQNYFAFLIIIDKFRQIF